MATEWESRQQMVETILKKIAPGQFPMGVAVFLTSFTSTNHHCCQDRRLIWPGQNDPRVLGYYIEEFCPIKDPAKHQLDWEQHFGLLQKCAASSDEYCLQLLKDFQPVLQAHQTGAVEILEATEMMGYKVGGKIKGKYSDVLIESFVRPLWEYDGIWAKAGGSGEALQYVKVACLEDPELELNKIGQVLLSGYDEWLSLSECPFYG